MPRGAGVSRTHTNAIRRKKTGAWTNSVFGNGHCKVATHDGAALATANSRFERLTT